VGGFLHLARADPLLHPAVTASVDNLAFYGFGCRLWIEFLNFSPRFFKNRLRATHSLQKYDGYAPFDIVIGIIVIGISASGRLFLPSS
jgi:hypothetical protein